MKRLAIGLLILGAACSGEPNTNSKDRLAVVTVNVRGVEVPCIVAYQYRDGSGVKSISCDWGSLREPTS